MPRIAREKSSTKVYHIILRGNAKQDIFLEKQDYHKFIKEICETKEKYQYELYAYCLMTNYVHFILYDKKENLSRALQSLTVSYASYWNKKYDRVGHLFQDRFLSKKIETKSYLTNLCRYIHRNPEIAEIARMEEYPWSSYQEYVNDNPIVNKRQILKLFGNQKQEAMKQFIEFHKMNTFQNEMQNFVEYEMISKLKDEQARKYIEEILEIQDIQEIVKFKIAERNRNLRKLRNISGISNVQIARITGLSKRMVEIAMKGKEGGKET